MGYGFLTAARWVNDDQFLVVWGRLLRRTWGNGTRALQFSTFSILLPSGCSSITSSAYYYSL